MINYDKSGDFLPIPHCPTAQVTLCAVGDEYREVHKALHQLNVEVFPVEASDKLSRPVASHADLQIGMLNGRCATVGKGETHLKKRLEELGFIVTESEHSLSNIYPQEAMLDFLVLGNKMIGNQKIIKQYYSLKFSQTVHINQGYAKCNLAVINEHAIITSDANAAKACCETGIDVLQICPGHIELPGYDTGFIGGCCGLIAPNKLAICGQLSTHPDGIAIKNFLNKYNVSVIELCKGKLQDIGGIIPLKQKE